MSALFRSEFYTRWKDIGAKTYLFTACTNCYLRFSGQLIFKTGNIPSTWPWLNAAVRFECLNSAIDVLINYLWKTFHKPIALVVLTPANFLGRFSNFCQYNTRSQTGKSTGYQPTLKSLVGGGGGWNFRSNKKTHLKEFLKKKQFFFL